MPERHFHEDNRKSWNAATRAHNSHKQGQAEFFRNGGSTLFPEELELLGDVSRRSIVHLQCNAGQDTLSLSMLGAQATGVDISDEAVEFARKLSAESGVAASFVRSDIFDWFEQNGEQYDIAFSSYGVINWLSDLKAWGASIAKALKPGGFFVLVDFHPCFGMFENGWVLAYDYMGGKHLPFDGVGDYVADTGSIAEGQFVEGEQEFRNPHPSHEFAWGLTDIITPLLDAGLRLEVFREYPYCNGFRRFPEMRELPGRRFVMPEGMPVLPLMFGIRAIKPEA